MKNHRRFRAFCGVALLILSGVGIGLILVNRRLDSVLTRTYRPGFDWDWINLHEWKREALFAEHKVSVPAPNPRCQVILYDLDEQEAFSDMEWTGFDVRYVVRARMDIIGSPSCEGYSVRLIGARNLSGSVTVSIGGKPEKLTPDKDDSSYIENSDRIARESQPTVETSTARVLSDESERLFTNVAKRPVAWVQLDPKPVYEVDAFSTGNWVASYGVWSSAKDAGGARVVTVNRKLVK